MNAPISRWQPMWRIPLFVTVSTCAVLLGLFLYSPYGVVFYVVIVAPTFCLALLSILLGAAISRKFHRGTAVLLTLLGFFAASWLLVKKEGALRPELRWLLRSQHYKAALLAQPNTGTGFRHLEWDSWGFVPSGNNIIYLVYDPADALAAATSAPEPLKVSGIPCEVPAIHRLERQWYFVEFYTDEQWESCLSAK